MCEYVQLATTKVSLTDGGILIANIEYAPYSDTKCYTNINKQITYKLKKIRHKHTLLMIGFQGYSLEHKGVLASTYGHLLPLCVHILMAFRL